MKYILPVKSSQCMNNIRFSQSLFSYCAAIHSVIRISDLMDFNFLLDFRVNAKYCFVYILPWF